MKRLELSPISVCSLQSRSCCLLSLFFGHSSGPALSFLFPGIILIGSITERQHPVLMSPCLQTYPSFSIGNSRSTGQRCAHRWKHWKVLHTQPVSPRYGKGRNGAGSICLAWSGPLGRPRGSELHSSKTFGKTVTCSPWKEEEGKQSPEGRWQKWISRHL